MLLYHDMHRLMSLLSTAKLKFLEILFPAICLGCEQYFKEGNERLCHLCETKITINKSLICPVCGARQANNRKTCHKNSKYFLASASFYDDEIIKKLIWWLKYRKQTAAVKPLANILIQHLNYLSPAFQNFKNFIIAPIPLHPDREAERGFNQSHLIADILSAEFLLPLRQILSRKINTPPQAGLHDFSKRKANVANAFTIKDGIQIKNKNIILVDDVSTSGATLEEAVKILKLGGVRKVIGVVAAKTR